MKQCVLLFVKYPEPGMVKTRMLSEVGAEEAAGLYKAMVEDVLEAVQWLDEADLTLCCHPRERLEEMRHWLGPDKSYAAQRGRDLGARMRNAFAAAFAKGYERVVLVGSDIPDLDDNALREALESLDGDAACIGPARDGGYWLIGFSAAGFAPEAFTEVAWGTDRVLGQTLRWLDFGKKKITLLEERRDVDRRADLCALFKAGRLKPGSRCAAWAKRLCA
ncbi:MAG: TIGR04282 family arsenosugar biosynthesis glycosyltransferase [Desulfovibrionaceae bacterium]